MVNMSIDNDIQLEDTCSSCKNRLDTPKCNVCGETLHEKIANPNFDEELFNKLKS